MAEVKCSSGANAVPGIDYQRDEIHKYLTNKRQNKDILYIIDAKWMNRWKVYVRYDEETQDSRWKFWKEKKYQHENSPKESPGPIDNSKLFSDIENESGKVTVVSTAKENEDYYLIPQQAWEKLVLWYSLSNSTNYIGCIKVGPWWSRLCSRESSKENIKVFLRTSQTAYSFQSSSVDPIPSNILLPQHQATANVVTTTTISAEVHTDTDDTPGVPSEIQNKAEVDKVTNVREMNMATHEPKHSLESIDQDTINGPANLSHHRQNVGTPAGIKHSRSASSQYSESDADETEQREKKRICQVAQSTTPGLRGRGLTNLGNTCFMNSALQCLAHTPPLTEYFLQHKYKEDINEDNPLGMGGAVAEAYGELLSELSSENTISFSPFNFKRVIERFAPQFCGHNQQDSQELLTFLLDGLHEDLNRVREKPDVDMETKSGDREDEDIAEEFWSKHRQINNSVVVELFQGQLKTAITCGHCKKVTKIFDPVMYLPLSPPAQNKARGKSCILTDCLNQFTSEKKMGDTVSWYCSLCNTSGEATRKCDIWKLPQILIIHLTRFSLDSYHRSKITTFVQCQLKKLDWASYVKDPTHHNMTYDLIAVINHYGGLASGHYNAYCKNNATDKWYKYDDSHVSEISEEKVVTPAAYVLFYQKTQVPCQPPPPPPKEQRKRLSNHPSRKSCAKKEISGSQNVELLEHPIQETGFKKPCLEVETHLSESDASTKKQEAMSRSISSDPLPSSAKDKATLISREIEERKQEKKDEKNKKEEMKKYDENKQEEKEGEAEQKKEEEEEEVEDDDDHQQYMEGKEKEQAEQKQQQQQLEKKKEKHVNDEKSMNVKSKTEVAEERKNKNREGDKEEQGKEEKEKEEEIEHQQQQQQQQQHEEGKKKKYNEQKMQQHQVENIKEKNEADEKNLNVESKMELAEEEEEEHEEEKQVRKKDVQNEKETATDGNKENDEGKKEDDKKVAVENEHGEDKGEEKHEEEWEREEEELKGDHQKQQQHEEGKKKEDEQKLQHQLEGGNEKDEKNMNVKDKMEVTEERKSKEREGGKEEEEDQGKEEEKKGKEGEKEIDNQQQQQQQQQQQHEERNKKEQDEQKLQKHQVENKKKKNVADEKNLNVEDKMELAEKSEKQEEEEEHVEEKQVEKEGEEKQEKEDEKEVMEVKEDVQNEMEVTEDRKKEDEEEKNDGKVTGEEEVKERKRGGKEEEEKEKLKGDHHYQKHQQHEDGEKEKQDEQKLQQQQVENIKEIDVANEKNMNVKHKMEVRKEEENGEEEGHDVEKPVGKGEEKEQKEEEEEVNEEEEEHEEDKQVGRDKEKREEEKKEEVMKEKGNVQQQLHEEGRKEEQGEQKLQQHQLENMKGKDVADEMNVKMENEKEVAEGREKVDDEEEKEDDKEAVEEEKYGEDKREEKEEEEIKERDEKEVKYDHHPKEQQHEEGTMKEQEEQEQQQPHVEKIKGKYAADENNLNVENKTKVAEEEKKEWKEEEEHEEEKQMGKGEVEQEDEEVKEQAKQTKQHQVQEMESDGKKNEDGNVDVMYQEDKNIEEKEREWEL